MFSEPVVKGSGTVKVYDLGTGALIETVEVNSDKLRIEGEDSNDVYVELDTMLVPGHR